MSVELYITPKGRLETRETATPDPRRGEVRVAVERCGICGSDLHWFRGRAPAPEVCPGHEASGVVAAVGAGVDNWHEGDRVAVEPLRRCGACSHCRKGAYQLCPRLRIHGVHEPGAMASDMVVPATSLFRLPPTVDFELGALTEPLAVGVHAARLAEVGPGSDVLVLGAGTIGLLACAAARHLGASSVTVTARYPRQRDAARRLGCDQVVAGHAPAKPARRPSVVIETVGGRAPTLAEGVRAARHGGTVVVVGLFDGQPSLDTTVLLVKEVRLVGSMVYGSEGGQADFETALEILEERGEVLRSLVTDTFALERAHHAFEVAGDKDCGSIKVLVSPASEGTAAGAAAGTDRVRRSSSSS